MARKSMVRDVSHRDILEKAALTSGLLVPGGTAVRGPAAIQPYAGEPYAGAKSSGRFHLGGTATLTAESDVRPTGHVVRIDTSADGLEGCAYRYLSAQASDLTGAIHFEYYVDSGDCGGGSPRVSLGVDTDGDGTVDGYLHGLVDPRARGCPESHDDWVTVDLTDEGHRWETGELGLDLPYVVPWRRVVSNLGSHEIRTGILVDDSFWRANAAGVAYFDNVTIGDRTLSAPDDVVGHR